MKKKIKLFDPSIGKDEKQKISQVLESKFWASGSGTGNVLKFENQFKKYLGSDNCIAVNSDRIIKLACSDVSQQAVTVMKEEINKTKGSVFVLLDSNHSEEHVYEELKIITPLLRTDDYMVVEDTIKEETMNGMMKFMNKNDYYTYDAARESKFGMTMARDGFWIRK